MELIRNHFAKNMSCGRISILGTAKRGGTIERRELGTYPEGAKYKCQPKAWFTEDIMLEWVQEVLAPYVATAPPGIVPLLYLDSFRVHMMGSVVDPSTSSSHQDALDLFNPSTWVITSLSRQRSGINI